MVELSILPVRVRLPIAIGINFVISAKIVRIVAFNSFLGRGTLNCPHCKVFHSVRARQMIGFREVHGFSIKSLSFSHLQAAYAPLIKSFKKAEDTLITLILNGCGEKHMH